MKKLFDNWALWISIVMLSLIGLGVVFSVFSSFIHLLTQETPFSDVGGVVGSIAALYFGIYIPIKLVYAQIKEN